MTNEQIDNRAASALSGSRGDCSPRISVVIPTYNRPDALGDALAGLIASTEQNFEALVMDQSDDSRTSDLVRGFEDGRLVYHRMSRRGACPARNLGASLARAELVAFLDDDCVPRTDWLQRILGAFDDDPDLMFVFGQLTAPDCDPSVGGYPSFYPDRVKSGGWRLAMVAAGANMSCRKSFLREYGGFDELLGPDRPTVKSNDASIAYKAWRSGTKWLGRGDIEVVHVHGFRERRTLWHLYQGYAQGLGVNYGRFARRGDLRAVALFAAEQFDLTRRPVTDLLRLRRPAGAKSWIAHTQGFLMGIWQPARLGYVDGAEFRRMESEQQL